MGRKPKGATVSTCSESSQDWGTVGFGKLDVAQWTTSGWQRGRISKSSAGFVSAGRPATVIRLLRSSPRLPRRTSSCLAHPCVRLFDRTVTWEYADDFRRSWMAPDPRRRSYQVTSYIEWRRYEAVREMGIRVRTEVYGLFVAALPLSALKAKT